MQHAVQAALGPRAVNVEDADRNSAVAGRKERLGRRERRAVQVDGVELTGMAGKEADQVPAVGERAPAPAVVEEDAASEAGDLLAIVVPPGAEQEIERIAVAVDGPEEVHHQGLGTAAVHRMEDVQDSVSFHDSINREIRRNKEPSSRSGRTSSRWIAPSGRPARRAAMTTRAMRGRRALHII